MQKKVMALCQRVQFFLANPEYLLTVHSELQNRKHSRVTQVRVVRY